MTDPRDDEDDDLQTAFAATAAKLDLQSRQLLVAHAHDLTEQAATQSLFDQTAPQLDELTQRRLIHHAAGLASGRQKVASGWASVPGRLRQPRVLGLVAAAAALLAVVGARWWTDGGTRASAPPIAAAAATYEGFQAVAQPTAPLASALPAADGGDDALASALPGLADEQAGDQSQWLGLSAEEDDPLTNDLAGQLDSLHGVDASPLDGAALEWL